MTPTTERLPRPQRRALEREDAAFLTAPLARGPDARALDAHVRHLVRTLRDPARPSRAADAVAHMGALFDRSIPDAARKAIACRSGCGHCCRQRVSVTAVEALAVAQAIRTRTALQSAVVAADGKTHGLDGARRLNLHLACPLLVEEACAIYPARPLACRGEVSLDVNGCIAAFVQLQERAFRAPLDYTSVGTTCRLVLCAALTIMGRGYTFYELNAAVTIALEPEAEARWLAGDDVFAPAAMISVTPDAIAAHIAAMAARIEPTV